MNHSTTLNLIEKYADAKAEIALLKMELKMQRRKNKPLEKKQRLIKKPVSKTGNLIHFPGRGKEN